METPTGSEYRFHITAHFLSRDYANYEDHLGNRPTSEIANEMNVNLNVSKKHWEYFEANSYFDLIQDGYQVLNSHDQFYTVSKWPRSYP
jgi:hexosaminidase